MDYTIAEALERNIVFSSWQSALVTLLGLTLFTLISIDIRLLMMVTIQQRRERMNRQINERLRTLIWPTKHLADRSRVTWPLILRTFGTCGKAGKSQPGPVQVAKRGWTCPAGRRIRDAVEAALADIILLGTETHVRLAQAAVRELVAGHPVHTHDLVVSLRDFIREALSLDPIPPDIVLPKRGPTRPLSFRGRGKSERGQEGRGGGSMGMGGGLGSGAGSDDQTPTSHRP